MQPSAGLVETLVSICAICTRSNDGSPIEPCGAAGEDVSCASSSAAFVAMVKPADLGYGNDGALLGRLHRTRVWTVHIQ